MGLTQAGEEGLKVSNAGTNGQFLQKQSGDSGGLTWADAQAATGGGSDKIFYTCEKAMTTSWTVPNNHNAMVAGPLEIPNGVVLTVGDGETLTIV